VLINFLQLLETDGAKYRIKSLGSWFSWFRTSVYT